MVYVKRLKGETDDKLISRFRKKVIISGILPEVFEKSRHKKDSERRKEKKYRIKHQIELEKKRNY
ncbi:30S ribosomal protein S21 [Candidatus Microgenomates bacterium]|nr:MAG: 30S ribosomal protein S21 [Candidatus Microgenomates bacterium]